MVASHEPIAILVRGPPAADGRLIEHAVTAARAAAVGPVTCTGDHAALPLLAALLGVAYAAHHVATAPAIVINVDPAPTAEHVRMAAQALADGIDVVMSDALIGLRQPMPDLPTDVTELRHRLRRSDLAWRELPATSRALPAPIGLSSLMDVS